MNYFEMAQSVGQSFYCYDLDALKKHLEGIKAALHPEIKVWYACKANPLSEILRLIDQHGLGIDVASLGELHQARTIGTKKILATGPAKSRAYLASLLEAQVKCIVIESHNQLKDLNELCGKLSLKQDVLLRVQLDHHSEDKSFLGGSSITPFGLGLEDWKRIDIHQYKHLNVLGLHTFQWGNILDVKQLQIYWTKSLQDCRSLAYEMKINLQVVDLGGGLGLSYLDEKEMNFLEVQNMLLELKKEFEIPEIWLELGRFLVGKFGSYFTKIVDVKTVRGKHLLITEGGINHMARPALVHESFPCEALCIQGAKRKFTVHGPLCTALDTLGDYELPLNLKPGDWLMFKRCGAYGFTESMPYFLCHYQAGEAIIKNGDFQIVRYPKTHLDWPV